MKNIQLRDQRSCFVLQGRVESNSKIANVKSLDEMIFGGKIIAANEVDGKYEIAGESLSGSPNGENCLGCSQLWKGCDSCPKAKREKQWIVLPEGATVSFKFNL